jgi:hypothetical protein
VSKCAVKRDNRFYIRGELNPGDRIADQGAFKLQGRALVIQAGAAEG